MANNSKAEPLLVLIVIPEDDGDGEPDRPCPCCNMIHPLEDGDEPDLLVRCPHCGVDDDIVEVDQCVRWNKGGFDFEDGKLVGVDWHRGDSCNYQHVKYMCQSCRGPVLLPAGVSEDWT